MRVLVCGGRSYRNHESLFGVLDGLHSSKTLVAVIDGGARGADWLASSWALEHGVPSQTFRADWKHLGKAAGPIRNQRMIDEGKPDLVIAFPGASGTADMVRRAHRAGIPVREITA